MTTVIDTNVWVSAHLFGGVPKLATVKAYEEGLICMSLHGFEELYETLHKPKLIKVMNKLNLGPGDILQKIARTVAFIDDGGRKAFQPSALRDPDDSRILQAALLVQAGCILTGDQDLLVMNPHQGITILTPEQYINWEIS